MIKRNATGNNDWNRNEKLKLLTANEVAEIFQVSVRGIWRLVSIGKLPAPVKIGRLARWRKSDIEQVIESLGN